MILLVFPLTGCGGADEAADAPATDTPSAEAPVVETPEDLQVVQVRVEGDEYLFSPASVQAGKPVRLVFDPQGLPGCSRDITLPAYEITSSVSNPNTPC